ncbi:MAG: DUF4258 domain-containing protein [Candidatus Dadabacteria bacterium]
MNKKTWPLVLLIVLALIVVIIKRLRGPVVNHQTTNSTKYNKNRNRGFDRTISYLEYTNHARCRMDCRHISQKDIQEIMKTGEINYRKSEVNETPCPVYAVQGYTSSREHLRVIFGQCDYTTKVITCYNLDEDFECHCPGDENKYR